jgi:hypothetical protein
MKEPADFMKARGVNLGSLALVSSKGARLRLGLDLLGIPFKYISGYRSGSAAQLAIERGEINFYGESSPSYFSVIEPGLVKSGTVIPVYYDSIYDGRDFVPPGWAKQARRSGRFTSSIRPRKAVCLPDPSGRPTRASSRSTATCCG